MPIKALIFDFYDVLGLSPVGWKVEFNQELADWIAQQREKYKIGLISNAEASWLRPYLQEHGLDFDSTVISSEVGVMKPHPEIYQLALSQLQIEPNEAVFIDDIPQFVRAAKQEGMQAIVFENNQQLFHDFQEMGI